MTLGRRQPEDGATGRRGARVASALLGAALLALAIWWVARDRAALASAWDAACGAPPWLLAVFFLLPAVSWLLTGGMFWLLTARWRGFGEIGHGEMVALIGVSWLLNLLPLRPGMVGRVAYLKAYRQVPIRESVAVGIAAAACTVISAALLAGVAWVSIGARLEVCPWATPVLVLVPAALLGAVALLARRVWGGRAAGRGGRGAGGPTGALAGALALRVVDMGLMGLRLYAAFVIIGQPVGAGYAVWMAGPAQAVGLLPIHLGVQEWAVGLLAASATTGITAALANRLADTLVSMVVGFSCLLWLWRRAPGLSPTRPHGLDRVSPPPR